MSIRLIYQLLRTTCLMWLLAMSGQSLAADTDGDGYSDLDEVADGSDPYDSDDAPLENINWSIIAAINEQASDETNSPKYSLAGKVVGGYLANAKVCLDINKNLTCDDDETQVLSNDDAVYVLETSTVPTDFTLLAEAVPGVTVDKDLGIVTKAYTLMAPAELKNGLGKNNITVFTTLLSTLLNDDPSLLNSEETLERLQTALKISAGIVEPIGSDFINDGSDETQTIAVSFVALIKEIQQPLIARSNDALSLIKPNNASGATRSAILSAFDIAAKNNVFNSIAKETANANSSKTVPMLMSISPSDEQPSPSDLVDDEIPLVVSDSLGGEEEVPSIEEELAMGVVIVGDESNAKIGSDGICRYDQNNEETTIEFLTIANGHVSSVKHFFDGANWTKPCTSSTEDSDTYVLSQTGWIMEQNFGTNGYSFEGNCIIENEVPDGSIQREFCATTGNFGGESMSSVLPYVTFENPSDTFPPESRGFDVTWTRNVDRVEVYALSAGGSSTGRISTTGDSKSLEEFLITTVEKHSSGEPQYIWYDQDVQLKFTSYDSSSKSGEVMWFDSSIAGFPDSDVSGMGNGYETRPFEVRSVFGKQVAVLDRNGYSIVRYGAQEFTNRPIFAFLDDGDLPGIAAGVYRGDIETPYPSRHQLGRNDLDRFANRTFVDAVFESLGMPKLPR